MNWKRARRTQGISSEFWACLLHDTVVEALGFQGATFTKVSLNSTFYVTHSARAKNIPNNSHKQNKNGNF